MRKFTDKKWGGYNSKETKIFTKSNSFILLKDHENKSNPIFTHVDVVAMK
jgi:hypothetical protein